MWWGTNALHHSGSGTFLRACHKYALHIGPMPKATELLDEPVDEDDNGDEFSESLSPQAQ
jgi:hypothetical protein